MSLVAVRPAVSHALQHFVDEIGGEDAGAFRVLGGRTHWNLGRRSGEAGSRGDVRELTAPDGVVDVQASELIVRCGAGTTVAELDIALTEYGMQCPLDPTDPTRSTVGGVLAAGQSGVRRVRHGHVRDLLLEAQYVAADGLLRRAGAPVVKNVTGFDVCRLLVGSLGTLAAIGEVVLRCGPRPAARRWFTAEADPYEVRRRVFRPSSLLWDGITTWVQVEGSEPEVAADVQALGSGWQECDAPVVPLVASRSDNGRVSMRPSLIRSLPERVAPTGLGRGGWLAEIGTGTVHGIPDGSDVHTAKPDDRVRDMNRVVKDAFDPTGRCNPGVLPWI